MGTMKFEVPHSLPRDEVRQRVEQLLGYWGGKYGVKADWAGDTGKLSGKVMGISLDASFRITDKAVEGEGTDPGMLLRGKVKSYLTEKFGMALDPKKSLSELKASFGG